MQSDQIRTSVGAPLNSISAAVVSSAQTGTPLPFLAITTTAKSALKAQTLAGLGDAAHRALRRRAGEQHSCAGVRRVSLQVIDSPLIGKPVHTRDPGRHPARRRLLDRAPAHPGGDVRSGESEAPVALVNSETSSPQGGQGRWTGPPAETGVAAVSESGRAEARRGVAGDLLDTRHCRAAAVDGGARDPPVRIPRTPPRRRGASPLSRPRSRSRWWGSVARRSTSASTSSGPGAAWSACCCC